MRTPVTAAMAAALLLVLAACSGSDETAQPEEVDEAAADQVDAGQDETVEDEDDGTTILGLDETHTYDDGFSIHLSDFERFNEADEGYPGDGEWVVFTVTFTNGTEEPVEIDRIERSCQVDGVVGDYEAFDHVQYDWPTMIQPGDTGIWQPACEMPADAEELQWDMAVFQPGDEMGPSYPTVYWTGPVD